MRVTQGAEQHHMKGLRPGSSGTSEIRILFAFDPVRRAVLLVAGDKAGNWQRWYDADIPLAEKRYQVQLAELDTREYE
ncbi:type II toxin-antitoxin system RelE/ParE family toxin [Streptomyces atratus]|uniref:type II toxin-antitoxin system RelE/ParE family toxin n=1 Tax=Streptomyces atratus TaxID=1893 RepID=UPI003F53EA5F